MYGQCNGQMLLRVLGSVQLINDQMPRHGVVHVSQECYNRKNHNGVISCTNGCSICCVSYCHSAFLCQVEEDAAEAWLGYPRNRGRNKRAGYSFTWMFS